MPVTLKKAKGRTANTGSNPVGATTVISWSFSPQNLDPLGGGTRILFRLPLVVEHSELLLQILLRDLCVHRRGLHVSVTQVLLYDP